jgi:hypothetical protein
MAKLVNKSKGLLSLNIMFISFGYRDLKINPVNDPIKTLLDSIEKFKLLTKCGVKITCVEIRYS